MLILFSACSSPVSLAGSSALPIGRTASKALGSSRKARNSKNSRPNVGQNPCNLQHFSSFQISVHKGSRPAARHPTDFAPASLRLFGAAHRPHCGRSRIQPQVRKSKNSKSFVSRNRFNPPRINRIHHSSQNVPGSQPAVPAQPSRPRRFVTIRTCRNATDCIDFLTAIQGSFWTRLGWQFAESGRTLSL